MFDPDQFHDPEFRSLVLAARAVIAERVHRGVATPPKRLAVAALDEMPDEDDPAAVRAWAPSAAFRDAVRSVVLATLELYVGIVEVLADEADREDGDGMVVPPDVRNAGRVHKLWPTCPGRRLEPQPHHLRQERRDAVRRPRGRRGPQGPDRAGDAVLHEPDVRRPERPNSAACRRRARASSGSMRVRPAVYRVAWSLSSTANRRLRRRPLV